MFSRKHLHLSTEGIKLYNLAYNSKPSLRTLIYKLFTSDYDKRLEEVLWKCKISSIALIKKMENENIEKYLDCGVKNAVGAILSTDKKRLTKRRVEQNFRFFSDVMRKAFESNDHQTCMLYWYSLSHTYITRLQLREPSWFADVYQKISEKYGSEKNDFSKHIEYFINNGYGHDFLPSLFAVNKFLKKKEDTEELEETMNLFYSMYFLFHALPIPLYKDPVDMNILFEKTMSVRPL